MTDDTTFFFPFLKSVIAKAMTILPMPISIQVRTTVKKFINKKKGNKKEN